MQFSINDFFSKCDQIRRKVRIWSHLLKKFLLENFTFCAVNIALPSSMYDKDKGKSHIILRRKAVIFLFNCEASVRQYHHNSKTYFTAKFYVLGINVHQLFFRQQSNHKTIAKKMQTQPSRCVL